MSSSFETADRTSVLNVAKRQRDRKSDIVSVLPVQQATAKLAV
jgi:hypothetical protein